MQFTHIMIVTSARMGIPWSAHAAYLMLKLNNRNGRKNLSNIFVTWIPMSQQLKQNIKAGVWKTVHCWNYNLNWAGHFITFVGVRIGLPDEYETWSKGSAVARSVDLLINDVSIVYPCTVRLQVRCRVRCFGIELRNSIGNGTWGGCKVIGSLTVWIECFFTRSRDFCVWADWWRSAFFTVTTGRARMYVMRLGCSIWSLGKASPWISVDGLSCRVALFGYMNIFWNIKEVY